MSTIFISDFNFLSYNIPPGGATVYRTTAQYLDF